MTTARATLATALVLVTAALGALVAPLTAASAASAAACVELDGSLTDGGARAGGTTGCADADAGASTPEGDDLAGGGEPAGGGTGGASGGTGAGGQGGATSPAPAPDPFEWSRAPDCPGNAPGSGSEALCGGATLTCPDPGEIRYVTYQRPRGGDGPWAPVGVACLTPGEAAVLPGGDGGADAAPAVVVTEEQFRELPFAPGTAVTQPPGGELLIAVPTVVHAVGQVQVLPTVVLGVPVAVRATPASWTWDFGDGTSLGPVADPGAPWPAGPHAHAYAAPGRYSLVMSTTYTGEFSVDGGAWEAIAGTTTVASPPQPVVAHSARSRLVADAVG